MLGLGRLFSTTLLLVTLLSLSLQSPPPAGAQSRSASEERRARASFEQGRAAFSEGRYEEALALFRDSYTYSHKPVLLYNIGNTLDRLRRDSQAIEQYEQYLLDVPDAPNRAEVESRLVVLRRMASERAQPAVVVPMPMQTAAASLEVAPAAPLQQQAPQSEVRPLYKKWWLWTAIGVAVVAGVVVGVVASSPEEPRQGPLFGDATTRKVEL